jgi:CheY-like chemotaxis protein
VSGLRCGNDGPMVGGGRSVLVVEDDKLTLGLLAETLTQSGFVVGAASTATEAWRMWEQMDPDAVVLDVDLGVGVNGFDLADAFRAQEPYLAVLFLSNLPDARFAGRNPESLPKNVGYVRKGQLSDSKELVTSLDAVPVCGKSDSAGEYQRRLQQRTRRQLRLERLRVLSGRLLVISESFLLIFLLRKSGHGRRFEHLQDDHASGETY